MRLRSAARVLLVGLLAATAPRPAGAEEPPPNPWAWLESGVFEDAEVKPAPGLAPEEAAIGLAATRSAVTFAMVPAESEPPALGRADGAGFLVSADGLVVGPWSLLSAARESGPWLVGRTFDGPWVRAFVLGGSWACELGVARLATRRRDLVPLPLAPLAKEAPGRRFLACGTALGRRHVLTAAMLVSVEWFDPLATGGRVELKSASGRTLGKGAFPLSLRFAGEWSAGPGEGTPVLALDGRCVAVVTRLPSATDGSARPVIRPVDLARRLLFVLETEGRLDGPDLGMRFEPTPASEGVPARLPPDLERLRATKKERGGAVVGLVSNRSPALGTIWPGDLVLEIEGHPVFGDVPESVVAALEALPLESAIDVVLWRASRRETVTVRALRGRTIYGDFQAEHDARGGARRPSRK